ncbi:hypothetical protein CERSUDRAFT_110809 [Gelatoporia subvermispora B]|uniref:Uncharacterized protein n=1 Tax=Ceriporiopsis subvermispora (strain B) TaxID=914234 RepID=M2RTK1_CERS8|nr:hypothetical protein CERSUDRAFT_110809 [Gelatoporia subvermispora B]
MLVRANESHTFPRQGLRSRGCRPGMIYAADAWEHAPRGGLSELRSPSSGVPGARTELRSAREALTRCAMGLRRRRSACAHAAGYIVLGWSGATSVRNAVAGPNRNGSEYESGLALRGRWRRLSMIAQAMEPLAAKVAAKRLCRYASQLRVDPVGASRATGVL